MKNSTLVIIAALLSVILFSAVRHKMVTSNEPIYQQVEAPNEVPAPPVPDVKPEPEPKKNVIELKSYEDALKASAESKKTLIVIFGATWCEPCLKMKNNVLSTEKVKEALKNHVVYYVDVDKERAVVNKHKVWSVPVVVAIAPDGKVLKQHPGYMDEKAFIEWLKGTETMPVTPIRKNGRRFSR